ncbi:hypothetical protein GCM10019016_083030 [Streptomyces prasinosporus]|uniref:Uncharacterized protein n=1 Tax=Streptomyces prasinosporus TaxID=68256 RepID=A0ABP6U3U3_9ACTN
MFTKACTAITWSSEEPARVWSSSSFSRASSSEWLSPYATDSFSAAYATVGPSARARATFSASARSSAAGTSRFAMPSSYASRAGTVRGKSSRSVARPGPITRGSVHEMPESAVSATPANEVLKDAVSATIR